MKELKVLLVVLCACAQKAWSCDDLDSQACAGLLSQNQNLCHEEVFAHAACARTCGMCAVTCFHCDNPVSTPDKCNNTKMCALGEKCMLTSISSSEDGHSEFRMTCATNEMCDGKSIFFGRRDVSTHCCSDDFCNQPKPTTTTTRSTTTATTTTTKPTTTTVPTCVRDLLFLVEDSRSSGGDAYVKQFLSQITSPLTFGVHDNLISLLLFDTGIKKSGLSIANRLQTDKFVADVIRNLTFEHNSNDIDYQDIITSLTRYHYDLRQNSHYDRRNVENVLLIISDHASQGTSYQYHNVDITRESRAVIVINVGYIATHHSAFSQLATGPDYIFNLNSYPDLTSIKSQVLQLLCR